jgi:hypothetical protein
MEAWGWQEVLFFGLAAGVGIGLVWYSLWLLMPRKCAADSRNPSGGKSPPMERWTLTPLPDGMKHSEIIKLIELASSEIEAHRQRQIKMFREAVVVVAVVTGFGVTTDAFANEASWVKLVVGAVAAAACLATAFVGSRIIREYKERIYFVKDRREELVHLLGQQRHTLGWCSEPDARLFSPIRTHTTSGPYAIALLSLAAAAAIILFAKALLVLDQLP